MTIEEIKTMIDSTINENGERQITGKALNLALNELVSAIENASSGGSGAEVIYLFDDMKNMTLTPEHQAHNAEVYVKYANAVAEGKPIPPCAVDCTVAMIAELGLGTEGTQAHYNTRNISFIAEDSEAGLAQGFFGLIVDVYDIGMISLLPDGSLQLMN